MKSCTHKSYRENLEQLKKTIVYGTQYYRIIPPPEEWDSDMKHIKSLGMDTIKIWAQWARIEKKQGDYDWNDLEKLMATAKSNNVKVIINFILYHIPLWSFEKNDPGILPLDRIPKERFNRRYLGGYYACWDHPGVRTDAGKFIEAFTQHFSEYENLLAWDIWNEPDKPECACKHSAMAYRSWLKKNYFKSVKEFNKYTGECYANFDEIVPPTNPGQISEILLYEKFKFWSLGEIIKFGYESIRSVDKTHPIMTHSHSGVSTISRIPWPGNLFPTSFDDWSLANSVDFYGGSTHEIFGSNVHKSTKDFCRLIINLETKRAITKNYFWNSEVSIENWHHTGERKKLEPKQCLFDLFTFISHGSKGFLFWQYKPERVLGDESPGMLGTVNLDGSDTESSIMVKKFGLWLKENEKLLVSGKVPEAENAILFSMETSIVASNLRHVSYADAFIGANYLLWKNNIIYDIVRYASDILDCYKRIYVPLGLLIEPEMACKLKEFVKNGGTLIIEPGFARYEKNGWFAAKVPTMGLSDTFGYKEKDVFYEDQFKIKLKEGTIRGAEERYLISCKSANVLGKFNDRKPAVVEMSYGKGKVIYFSSHISVFASKYEMLKKEQELFLKTAGFKPFCYVDSATDVTSRLLETDNEKIMFIFNHSSKNVNTKIKVNFPFSGSRLLWGDKKQLRTLSNNIIEIKIPPSEVIVVLVKKTAKGR